jgi:hypothetical protein
MQPAQTLGRHAAAAARGLPPCILTYTHICAVRACHSGSKHTCRSAAEQSLQDSQQLHGSPESRQQQWQQQQQQQSSRAPQEQQQQPSAGTLEAPGDPLLPVDDWAQRSRLLVGAEGLAKLASLNVLLVGLGGVGSFAGEQGQLTGSRGSLHRWYRISDAVWVLWVRWRSMLSPASTSAAAIGTCLLSMQCLNIGRQRHPSLSILPFKACLTCRCTTWWWGSGLC